MKSEKLKNSLTMFVAAMMIVSLIATIGSATAASYVWVESNVKGVGYKNAEYQVDTDYGLANGIEMSEVEAGSGIVTTEKWTLEVNKINPKYKIYCLESLEETKEFDVEYFPITYQNHSYDAKWLEKKCVKNYVIGAVTDANFVQCEKLQKKESVVTNTGREKADGDVEWEDLEDVFSPDRSLTQTVTADVLGISHIGFAAKDPDEHHHTIAYGKEETVGQFQIEKTIDIRLNCTQGQVGDWLGCP